MAAPEDRQLKLTGPTLGSGEYGDHSYISSVSVITSELINPSSDLTWKGPGAIARMVPCCQALSRRLTIQALITPAFRLSGFALPLP